MNALPRWTLVTTSCVLVGLGRAPTADGSQSTLTPLATEVRRVVQRHFPEAPVTLSQQTIHVEFNTRRYMVHEPLRTGQWQDAREEVGPQKGGIYGDLELRAGRYAGPVVVPQVFDKRYFKLLVMAPYATKLDHHLYVRLKYSPDAPPEFLEELARLVNGFEAYVAAGGRT